MKEAKTKLMTKSNSQSNIYAQNIAQAKIIEQQINALDKDSGRQQTYKEEVKMAKQIGDLKIRKMSQDNLMTQPQQQVVDTQKYKQKCHDLQKQLNMRDKEIMNRQAKLKESHEQET